MKARLVRPNLLPADIEALADEEELLQAQLAAINVQIAQLESNIEARTAEYSAAVFRSQELNEHVAAMKADISAIQKTLLQKAVFSGHIQEALGSRISNRVDLLDSEVVESESDEVEDKLL